MTNLNKFAAQQLTKKQMNEVKGGDRAYCSLFIDGEDIDFSGYVDGNKDEARQKMLAIYGKLGYEVICHDALY